MPDNLMEQIVSLCKRRAFIYPASEIYGGIRGFWDYGPLGSLLKNNIRDWWWRNMVECPPTGPDGHPIEMVGLDSAIIQHPKTWEASGHTKTFADPMVDCSDTQQSYRADHLKLIWTPQQQPENLPEAARRVFSFVDSDELSYKQVFKKAAKFYRKFGMTLDENPQIEPFVNYQDQIETIVGPDTEKPGTLSKSRPFNLMLDTYPGSIRTEENKAYLRPETAQGIFLNFKNIIDTTRVKVPFGVAQIGKSFRNEVTPRNFVFRSREFEQMEMEWFCHPDEAAKWYEFWKAERMKWWESLGVEKSNLRFRDHEKDELSHYSKMTVDIEYKYPFTAPDFGELEGIAHRGCFDLSQHQQHSGQKLDYFDQDLQLKLKEQGVGDEEVKARSRYIPNVIEPASGLTRAVLVLLCEAYKVDESRPSKMFLKFAPKFAPIKCGVFPLVNKDGLPEIAEKLYLDLRTHFMCEYDAKQTVGKRYARMDEIGTPYCITVDGQTKEDQTVTVRDRDTMTQQRIGLDKAKSFLLEKLGGATG